MDFQALKKIVRQGEGLHIEFKLKVCYPHKIMREAVAFANTQGGKLIIGVADDGKIKGVKYPKEDDFEMTKAIKRYISHPIDYTLYPVSLFSGNTVLVYDIKPSPNKPVCLITDFKAKTGVVYVRSADKSLQASREMKRLLKDQSRDRRVLMQFGDHERTLLQYLGRKEKINVDTYAEIAHIPRRIAAAILVRMTLANVINICPQEGGRDFFTQKL